MAFEHAIRPLDTTESEGIQSRFSTDTENDDPHAAWDEFVLRTPGGDIEQSTPWAHFRRAMGFECHRIVTRDGPTILGGAQLYMRRVGPWKLAYIPYGPLAAHDAPKGAVTQLVRAIRCDLTRRGAVFVQPPFEGDHLSTCLFTCGFTSCEVQVAPTASLRLDLSRPIEELEHHLSHQVRPYIRRWGEMGVEVRRGTREDLGLLAELHARSARFQGFTPVPLAYIERLWDALSHGDHVRMFVGSIGGQDVAAELLSNFGGILSERIKGFDREDRHAKARIPAALVWAAIVDGHDRGERWLDSGGIARAAAVALLEGGHHAAAVKAKHRFKLSFGGRPVLYPTTVGLICDPVLRATFAITCSIKPGRRLVHHRAGRMRLGSPGCQK